MKSRITELLGIKYPIFQGGMVWVADGDFWQEPFQMLVDSELLVVVMPLKKW